MSYRLLQIVEVHGGTFGREMIYHVTDVVQMPDKEFFLIHQAPAAVVRKNKPDPPAALHRVDGRQISARLLWRLYTHTIVSARQTVPGSVEFKRQPRAVVNMYEVFFFKISGKIGEYRFDMLAHRW